MNESIIAPDQVLKGIAAQPPFASLRGAPFYKQSPYAPEKITQKTRTTPGKLYEYVDEETGEVKKLYELDKVSSTKRDELPYIKVFKPELLNLGNLSVPGLKLLCYIMYNLSINSGEITIDINAFLDQAGYSAKENQRNQRNRVQYYKAVLDLLNNGFMVRKSNTETSFFINVNRFFNGDRTTLPELSVPMEFIDL